MFVVRKYSYSYSENENDSAIFTEFSDFRIFTETSPEKKHAGGPVQYSYQAFILEYWAGKQLAVVSFSKLKAILRQVSWRACRTECCETREHSCHSRQPHKCLFLALCMVNHTRVVHRDRALSIWRLLSILKSSARDIDTRLSICIVLSMLIHGVMKLLKLTQPPIDSTIG